MVYAYICGEECDMMTIGELARSTGLSVRALRHYDRIGLLKPAAVSEAGYRLYDGAALERLQQILLFRELEFPLKEIRTILDRPDFDRERALEQQLALLRLRRAHLDRLIAFAREIQQGGTQNMDFSAFDTREVDAYIARAREQWGETRAWEEYERKHGDRPAGEERRVADGMMDIFAAFGDLRDGNPEGAQAQALATRLQAYITEHYYACTTEIFAGLADLYDAGGDFTRNIDRAGGPGTAAFAAAAIRALCRSDRPQA